MSNFPIIVAILLIVLVIYVLTRNVRSRAGHNLNMSPDTVSSLFPDRPIRPLPKRRLREKLSPRTVDTIAYPPSTHETTPLFYYPPYNFREDTSPPRACSTSPSQQTRRAEEGCNYTPRRNGLGLPDGDDEEPALRSTLVTRSPPEILTRGTQRSSKPDIPNPQPPLSATSSVDGYDVFENTNNKKKRKIPSAGELSVNGTQGLNNEIAISAGAGRSPTDESHNDRAHSHSVSHPTTGTFSSNNQGISGPGRGRLGRSRNGRSPLRALSDGNSNAWVGRGSKATASQWAPGGTSIILLLFSCSVAVFPNSYIWIYHQRMHSTELLNILCRYAFRCGEVVQPWGFPGLPSIAFGYQHKTERRLAHHFQYLFR